MGGGGGGGDYVAQQSAQDAKNQQARDALNAMFGIGPSGGAASVQKPGGAVSSVPGAPSSGGETFYNDPSIATMGGQYPDIFDPSAGQMVQRTTMGGVPGNVGNVGNAGNAGTDINANKTGLDDLYAKVRNDAFTAGKQRLDDKQTQAARNLRFTLMGQGLNGGSVDVDQNALLGRTYNQGLLDLGSKADEAKNNLQSSDEQTRLGLLQSIDSGMDQGSALSSALNQMNINSQHAAAGAQGTDLGDLFGNAGLLYSQSNAARGAGDASSQFPYMGYPMMGGYPGMSYPGYRRPSSGASGQISNSFTGRP